MESDEPRVEAIPFKSYLVWYRNTDVNKGLHERLLQVSDLATLSYLDSLDQDAVENAQYEHLFCGSHCINGAWCPNCDKPLLRFLDLDASDPRLGLPPSSPRHVPLLYCWTCNIAAIGFVKFFVDRTIRVDWHIAKPLRQVQRLIDVETKESSQSAPFMYQITKTGDIRLLQYGIGGVSRTFPYSDYPIYFPSARASLLALEL